jgi:hypothetical protein
VSEDQDITIEEFMRRKEAAETTQAPNPPVYPAALTPEGAARRATQGLDNPNGIPETVSANVLAPPTTLRTWRRADGRRINGYSHITDLDALEEEEEDEAIELVEEWWLAASRTTIYYPECEDCPEPAYRDGQCLDHWTRTQEAAMTMSETMRKTQYHR